MKIFKRVLAMTLALFTVLAILPMNVFADAWADVSVGKDGDRTKVTLTLNADVLADILQKDGISSDLLEQLKAGAAIDVEELTSIFTVDELFEIVPRDEWLKVFDIKEIMQELDAEQLLGYIDSLPGLLNEVMSNEEKAAKLEALLKQTKGIESCIDALALLQGGYLTAKDSTISQESLIMNRISEANRKALINLIRKDPVKFDQLIDDLSAKLASFDLDGLRKLLDVDGILEDGAISIGSVVDPDKVQGLINDKKLNLNDIVDVDKVQGLLGTKINLNDIVDTAKVQSLIGTKINLNDIVDTAKVQSLIGTKINLNDIVDTAKVQSLIGTKINLNDIVDTAKVQSLIGTKINLNDIVDTAKVQSLIGTKITLNDIVDTAKVQSLIGTKITLNDIVDTAKVQSLLGTKIQLTEIADIAKLKELVTDGNSGVKASDIVYIDVAAAKLGALVATSTTLADQIAACVDQDAVVEYLENNFEAEELQDYVTMDGTAIVAVDAAKLIRDRVLSVEDLVNNDLADEAALADIAVNSLSSLDGLFNIEKVQTLINAGTVKIENVINVDKVNTLLNAGTIKIDEIVNIDKVNALLNAGTIKIDEIVNIDKVNTLMNAGTIKIDEIVNIDKVNALLNAGTIKIDEIVNVDKVNALLNAGTIKIDEIVNIDKVNTLLNAGTLKIDEIVNIDKVKALLDAGRLAIDDIVNVDKVKTLIDNKTIAVEDIINTDKVKEMVEKGTLKIEDVIDIEAAKDALLALDNDVLMEYVNPLEAFRLIGLDKAIALVGGYEVAKAYIDIQGLISDIDLVATIKKIPADKLDSVINMKQLFGMLDVAALVDIVGFDTIFSQIDNNELMEIAKQINIGEKIRPLLRMVFDHILLNVDGLTVNGTKVAGEDKNGYLTIDAQALIAVAKDLLPTLNEIANLEDGKLLSMTLDIDYAVAGTAPNTVRKTKALALELVLGGNIERLKNAAASLQSLIDAYINKLEVSTDSVVVDVNVPELVTALYAQILDYDQLSDELKQKVMSVTNMSGEEMIAFVEGELTYGDLLEILDAVEPTKLYDSVLKIAHVQTALQKVDEKLDTHFASMSLDELVSFALNSDTTFEGICNKLSAMTGRNVADLIESLAVKTDSFANKAEEFGAIQTILNAIESNLGIDLGDDFAQSILDRAEGVDLVEAIANKVSAKIGMDVLAVLNESGADALYELALQKAAEHEDKYRKVINYIKTQLDRLPEEVLTHTLANAYQGNGVLKDSVSVTFSPKALVEKALNKLMGKVDVSEAQHAIDLIMSRIPEAACTMTLDATLRLHNIYRITYRSREDINNTGTPLFTALIPAGTDLSVVSGAVEGVAGYEFSGWATIDGEQITEMPAADTTVYADFHSVKLTFADESGNVLGNVMIPKNVALNSENNKYIDLIKEIERTLDYPGATTICAGPSPVWTWADGKLDLEKNIGLESTFAADTTLVISWRPNYYFHFVEGDFEYKVEDNNGKVKVTIYGDPTTQPVEFNFAEKIAYAMTNANVDLTISAQLDDVTYDFLYFSNATLVSLYEQGAEDVHFHYDYMGDTVVDGFKDSYYDGVEGVVFHQFDITVDGVKKDFDPNAPIIVNLPFAGAKANGAAVTNVYTLDGNGQRERMNATVTQDGFVTFEAVHFSDFVIANEFALDASFADEEGFAVSGALAGFAAGETVYLPAGATVDFKFDGITSYVVMDAWLNGTSLKDVTTGALPATFVMPDADATLEVLLQGATYNIYYVYNAAGTLTVIDVYSYRLSEIDRNTFTLPALDATLMATVEAAAPAGYSKAAGSVKWTKIDNNDLGRSDIYVFAIWTPVEYTVKFVDAQNVQIGEDLTGVTIEKYPTQDMLPLPALLDGMTKWTIASIGTPDASNVVTVTLNAVYAAVKYPVVAGQGVIVNKTEAAAGEEISVSATEKAGYTAMITVKKPSGQLVPVTDGKFVMPASAVNVTVTYVVNSYRYTIVNGTAGTSTVGVGLYGDTITFTVTLENGFKHKLDSNAYTLVSIARDGDKLVYTYAFLLDGDKTVTYTLEAPEASFFTILKIFNGKIFSEAGDPSSENENVKFNGWSTAILGSLRFATFSLVDEAASLLWLWILLGVLLLIAIIVLLYTLHIKGKWKKPMFLVRFVVWVVSLFFNLCLAVAALVIKIGALFGKKEDPTDYFIGEENAEEEIDEEELTEEEVVEAALAEEIVEEAAEEVVEEAAEEVVEEAAEEVVEEAAEEVVEEAAEEVVEEAAEEVVEEAAEEVVEEAAEEVVEEAAEEVVEEAAEEVVEETAEEVVEEATEEVVEEATEKAIDEDAMDFAKEVAMEVAVELAKEVAKKVAKKVAETVSENAAEKTAEEAAEEAAEEVTEEVIEEATEEATEEVTEEVAEEADSDEENK